MIGASVWGAAAILHLVGVLSNLLNPIRSFFLQLFLHIDRRGHDHLPIVDTLVAANTGRHPCTETARGPAIAFTRPDAT